MLVTARGFAAGKEHTEGGHFHTTTHGLNTTSGDNNGGDGERNKLHTRRSMRQWRVVLTVHHLGVGARRNPKDCCEATQPSNNAWYSLHIKSACEGRHP